MRQQEQLDEHTASTCQMNQMMQKFVQEKRKDSFKVGLLLVEEGRGGSEEDM